MRKLFSLFFLVLAFFLAYLLYKSIEEPIDFANERALRDEAVVEKLETIRTTQEMYRDITGEFAHSFDTLRQVLRNEDFLQIQVLGDPDDPNFQGEITYDTLRIPAIDSVNRLGIDLATLEDVPYTDGASRTSASAPWVTANTGPRSGSSSTPVTCASWTSSGSASPTRCSTATP